MSHNRRNFLKAGATIGASLLAAPAFSLNPAQSNATANEIIKGGKTNVKHRTLGYGKHSLEVSALGLGCMGMSYHRSFVPDRKSMIALIQKAFDMGVTLFDTAEVYGPYVNEELVGEALAPFRKKIILCSKFGFNIQNGQMAGLINERTKFVAANDNRATLPRYTPEAIKANWVMIDVLTEFGNHRGYTAAQVALAFLLAQKPWIVPIPGTTKPAHLQENLWSADIEFTPDELKGLNEALSKITVVGDRYTGQSAQQVRN